VFGDFFGHALPPAEGEFHGIATYMAHRLRALPFWLALAGIATPTCLYLSEPTCRSAWRRRSGRSMRVERKYGLTKLYSGYSPAGAERRQGVLARRRPDRDRRLMVNGSGRVVGWFSGVIRLVQSGLVNQYAVAMLIGAVPHPHLLVLA
jgi:NADH-quinone oxidoreductase subunit L